MKEKSEYEELNGQMNTIIKEAITRSKSNSHNPEIVYKDSEEGIELARYVIDGHNLYYDSKTGDAYLSKEELFEKGKNKMNAGVVYLHRPYADIMKMLLPYYEITCKHPLEEETPAFKLSYCGDEYDNPRNCEIANRFLPNRTKYDKQGNIMLTKIQKDWMSNTNLTIEDLLGEAYEATPAEETMLKEYYMEAGCLLKNVRAIAEDITRKNQNARRSGSRYQGNGPKTKGDDGRE